MDPKAAQADRSLKRDHKEYAIIQLAETAMHLGHAMHALYRSNLSNAEFHIDTTLRKVNEALYHVQRAKMDKEG